MLMPSIFTNTYFNDFFEDPFKSLDYNTSGLMTTDVKDTKDGYEMTMNLPGVKKEDIQAELKDGYLTINLSLIHIYPCFGSIISQRSFVYPFGG